MDEQVKYVKLKDIQEFMIEEVKGYEWFAWDATTNTPRKSDEYFEGAQKKYNLVTDKGQLSVSESQFGQMLTGAFEGESSEPVGKTFVVKTNGKEGMEIRYFINIKRQEAPKADTPATPAQKEEKIELSDIPF